MILESYLSLNQLCDAMYHLIVNLFSTIWEIIAISEDISPIIGTERTCFSPQIYF